MVHVALVALDCQNTAGSSVARLFSKLLVVLDYTDMFQSSVSGGLFVLRDFVPSRSCSD